MSQLTNYFESAVRLWVSKKYLSGEHDLTIDDLLAYSSVLLFPLNINGIDGHSSLQKIVTNAKSKYGEQLSCLTEAALNQFFYRYYKEIPLSEKKSFQLIAKSLNAWIAIGDNGNVIFHRDKMYYDNSSKLPYRLEEQIFGDVDDITGIPIDTKSSSNNTDNEEVHPSGPIEMSGMSKEQRTIKAIETKLSEWWRSTSHKEFPYVWKMKVSKTDYENLKAYLTNLFRGGEAINQWIKKDDNSKYLVVYVAEWFKWEYEGNVNNNALRAIYLCDVDVTKEIWNSRLLKEHQSNLLYNIGGKNERRLESLYALGGFPLKRGDFFENAIEKIFECRLNDEITMDDWTSITESLGTNSFAFNESISSPNGSLHQYVNYILKKGNLPISVADKEKLTSLQETITTRKKEKEKKKFRLDWEAEKVDNTLKLSLLVTFANNLDRNIDRSIIPNETALSWGVKDEANEFTLEVKNGLSTLRKFTFYRLANGHFSCYSNFNNYVIASDLPKRKGISGYSVLERSSKFIDFQEPITIVLSDSEPPIQKFSLEEVIRFRYDSWYRWTSSQRRGALSLFIPNKKLFDSRQQYIADTIDYGNTNWMWIPVTSPLKDCTYNGKELKATPYVYGELFVLPAKLYGSDIVHYKNGMYATYRTYEEQPDEEKTLVEEKDVFLISSTDDLEVRLQYKDNEQLLKAGDEGYEIELIEGKEGHCGYHRYRIIYQNKKIEVDCFVIEENHFANQKREPLDDSMELQASSKEVKDYKYRRESYKLEELHKSGELYIYGELYYYKYVGEAGIYDIRTNKLLTSNENGIVRGIIKFRSNYCYRDQNGVTHKIYNLLNKEEVIDALQQDVERDNINAMYTAHYDLSDTGFEGLRNGGVRRVELTPFSLNEIQNENGKYIIKGKRESELRDCCFYYCTFNLEDEREVRPSFNEELGGFELKFDRNPKEEGFIFQSLKDKTLKPDNYYRWIIVPKNEERSLDAKTLSSKRLERLKSIRNRIISSTVEKDNIVELAIRQFEFAKEHNLYFVMFDYLYSLVYRANPELLVRFYKGYIERCNSGKIDIDYSALHRMAYEFKFNWWLMPRGFSDPALWEGAYKDLLRRTPANCTIDELENILANAYHPKSYDSLTLNEISKPTKEIIQQIKVSLNQSNKQNVFLDKDNWKNRKLYIIDFKELAQVFENFKDKKEI